MDDKKLTALQQLAEFATKHKEVPFSHTTIVDYDNLMDKVTELLEVENNQMKDAYDKGSSSGFNIAAGITGEEIPFDKYYSGTYKTN